MSQQLRHQSKIAQSATHQLFEQISPLKHLTLTEVTDPKTQTGVFLTTRTLKALYEIHRKSLRTLDLCSMQTPSPAFTAFLSAFLMATPNLRHLRLAWPQIEAPFLDCLPPSLSRLELAVGCITEAQTVLDRLVAMSYRLRFLRDVQFELTNQQDCTPTEPVGFSLLVHDAPT